ncbi:AAA family ATPase [Methylovulum psychrotolerans]|uniref:Endonuclease GajA/Old nuclease/RecF-like AAA domain-containing protein n=1 Tax=Methylovulum psychrotolerans TaxID=1704499 RepID=A0A2S5CRD2_9GAMM|nr:AAA family ATPase [Methylovulum psychrotolerans]POZ53336.1 hypothetical protein AADEFJLK_00356 [Methylovulum psychrotolerans]
MESIEINGFLTIGHACFEIKKINILIGAQAQGKSVIAKLVYFFKHYFSAIFLESIGKFQTKKDIEKKCLEQFEQIFPRYSWANQEFAVVYRSGGYDVSIIRNKVGNKFSLKLNYCKELTDLHRQLKNAGKPTLWADEFGNLQGTIKTWDTLDFKKINNHKFNKLLAISVFIPAGRSFFANLQKNIFSFLANNIDIDPFIKEFGFRYESSKQYHIAHQRGLFQDSDREIKIALLISNIIAGEYVYADEQDWILNNGKKTNLANASSGQQESLPMMLILKIWSAMLGANERGSSSTFFIEEPEAHLFPVSQKQIISLIATIYNTFGHSFFITTHSPYILTAINNLVVGQDAYDKATANGDAEQLKKLAHVLPTDELIRLEDVSAYTLNKGKLESIIDSENRLIGANLLDAVSDEFDKAFGVATEILYGAG